MRMAFSHIRQVGQTPQCLSKLPVTPHTEKPTPASISLSASNYHEIPNAPLLSQTPQGNDHEIAPGSYPRQQRQEATGISLMLEGQTDLPRSAKHRGGFSR